MAEISLSNHLKVPAIEVETEEGPFREKVGRWNSGETILPHDRLINFLNKLRQSLWALFLLH